VVARVKGQAEGTDIESVKIGGQNQSETEGILVSSKALHAKQVLSGMLNASG
jgi:hypothetical protein